MRKLFYVMWRYLPCADPRLIMPSAISMLLQITSYTVQQYTQIVLGEQPEFADLLAS